MVVLAVSHCNAAWCRCLVLRMCIEATQDSDLSLAHSCIWDRRQSLCHTSCKVGTLMSLIEQAKVLWEPEVLQSMLPEGCPHRL